jgi:hypothetical protein
VQEALVEVELLVEWEVLEALVVWAELAQVVQVEWICQQ